MFIMHRRRRACNTANNDQKCWRCKWATGLPTEKTGRPCPNTQPGEDHGPVIGWEATARKRVDGNVESIGYDLPSSKYCPLFEQDDPSKYKAQYPDVDIWKQ